MPDLEWLITDKFTIDSGGKTPQTRRMESAAKCFSTRMCPSTLNFASENRSPKYNKSSLTHTTKSPLKSIENYMKQSPVSSRHSALWSHSKAFGEDVSSMEKFQCFNSTSTWSEASCSSSLTHGDCDTNCFVDNKHSVFGTDDVDGCPSRAPTFRGSCRDDDGLDNLVPQCSGLKMARLENKENFMSLLSSSTASHVLCEDVVRSPTRLDLSCLLSPSRRKAAQPSRRQDNKSTPSKFSMVQNSLNQKSPSFAVPTPKKQVEFTSMSLLDYNSRDSGCEHSMSCDKADTNSIVNRMECSLDIGDELTQSACHMEDMYSTHGRSKHKASPHPQGSAPPDNDKLTDLEEYEYDTLHDLEDFDTSDVPPGSSMSKYEIISTDSPDIAMARGTPSAVGRILADNFEFGSPIGEEERSENFVSLGVGAVQKSMGTLYGRIPVAMRSETTRMLNFDTPSPTCKRRDSKAAQGQSLQEGSVFKLAIEKLSCRPSRCREVVPHDSGLGTEGEGEGGDEDTLLVLDELENNEELQEPHIQPASLRSLIHDAVIHQGKDDEERDVLPMEESSPLHLPLRRPAFRRCFSLTQSSNNLQEASCLLYDSPKSGVSEGFKRPELSRGGATLLGRKRRKQSAGDLLAGGDGSQDCEMGEEVYCTQIKTSRPALQRAMSDNEATIKMALTRSLEDSDLIGDFSGAYRLPVVRSQHSDLKVLSPDTLAGLMEGAYSTTVPSYQIIDCRYPYEYTGGHIRGAANLYTEGLIHEALVTQYREHSAGHILIFHCEFSMQRGPTLMRYLRCVDRALHRASYPALLHPELYLLGGGYCLFSSKHPAHTQGGYTTMLDPHHTQDRRKYQGGKYKGKRAQ